MFHTGLAAFDGMVICAVDERVGGAIQMLGSLTDCRNAGKLKDAAVLENPQIAFSSASAAADLAATHTLGASEGTARSKCHPWQCPSSAPAAPQGAPGGSGQLRTPRVRPSHWAPSHCLGGSSEPPPKSPISLPLTT